MDSVQFIEITESTTLVLFLVGFIGGMVSGFIGSGGAFVLTPAMMSLGVPAAIAVASNMAHKFPKALVGAYKRNKYGQVDIKLGIVMGIFAEFGVLYGKTLMVAIRESFGAAGTNLYVSLVFVVVLSIVGGLVLRDGLRDRQGISPQSAKQPDNQVIRWVRKLNLPGTMIFFKSLDAKVSFLVLAPLGFATGLLAASIAVGGFIGVPAMMYVLGLPALTASATELVVAFVMGLGGSFFYALDGFVDIRLSMIILAGSLFGIQIGAIGTTYVKDYVVKLVMAAIMLLVLVSRFFYIPGYLSDLKWLLAISPDSVAWLDGIGQTTLVFALLFGAVMILMALLTGMREYRIDLQSRSAHAVSTLTSETKPVSKSTATHLSPMAGFERFLVASDDSEFSAAALRESTHMAKKCGAEVHVMSLVPTNIEHEGLGESFFKQELESKQSHLQQVEKKIETEGVKCFTHLVEGSSIADGIVNMAEHINCDLIIMGRRGNRGLARFMLGRATARVIGNANCTVLVVPRAARIEAKHIVLATDGSRSAESAAITAAYLAKFCKAPVTVVSVTPVGAKPEQQREAQDDVNRIVEYMEDEGIDVDAMSPEGKPEEWVVSIASEKGADLIVTGSHGRSELGRVLLGSTTERILNTTTCAVMIVKVS